MRERIRPASQPAQARQRSSRHTSRPAPGTPAERPASRPAAADYGLPEHVSCPFCGNDDTELHSPFGPQLSVATYWCRRCHTAFDWVKRRQS